MVSPAASLISHTKWLQPLHRRCRPGWPVNACLNSRVLTSSDVNGSSQLTLLKPCGEALFPVVGETKTFRDPLGKTREFRHASTGHPGRHRLCKGWSHFVCEMRLAAGDTIIFRKNAVGELLIDFRRTSQISGEPPSEVWKIKSYLFGDHRGDTFSASFFNRLAWPSQMRPIP